ncbi:hypothetical protein CDD83_1508 [Cordyceps sp. RAO-2017]|nr:hypothetical protein CDD83_1508 [Cordyceps sp. RAO-2017]
MARRDDDGHGPAALRPNMVVTIEPGLYFCRPYLEARFVGDARHARFIDPAALEAYYPVGGVRIEDCVLVTARGHEVLTTAPKGAELIDVINHALHPPPPPPGH